MNEGLTAYIMRTDARILAFEMTLGEILKLTPEQKKMFGNIQETNFKLIYQQMVERVEKDDPALAARLLDGQDIYSGLV